MKSKKRLFNGMSYREVQRFNSDQKSKLPKKDQNWLKENGYKNVGWNHVIKLYEKVNDFLDQLNSDDDTLEELFLKADRIGSKYQTPQEIDAFNQQLSAEINQIADQIDQQFPETEMEFIDYSQPSHHHSSKKLPLKNKRRIR